MGQPGGRSLWSRIELCTRRPRDAKTMPPLLPMTAFTYSVAPLWLMWKYLNLASNIIRSLSVSSSFLENTKAIQNTNISSALPPTQEGTGAQRRLSHLLRGRAPLMLAQPWLPVLRSRWCGGEGLLPDLGGALPPGGCLLKPTVPTEALLHTRPSLGSLCLNPRCLLSPVVLSSPRTGPGILLDPFTSQARPYFISACRF